MVIIKKMGLWKPISSLQSYSLATKSYIFFIRYVIISLRKCKKIFILAENLFTVEIKMKF
jgi:hypothetical protein